MMRRPGTLGFVAFLSLGLACQDSAPSREVVPPTRQSIFEGEAPNGFLWKGEQAVTQCLVAARPDSGQQAVPAWTDSVAIIDIAFRFLGSRANRRTDVPTRFVPGGDGTLVQISDTTPGTLDGTATLYITRYGCVSFLGW